MVGSASHTGTGRGLSGGLSAGMDAELEECLAFGLQRIQEYKELEEWLADTRSGLWILSNGPDVHQRRKFSALKTDRFFPESHTFTSGQIGFAKPDPRAFQAVTADPSDFWYIGDNYHNDMEGAKALGWHTIHFDRRHQGSGPAADYIAHDESELTALLRQLEGEYNV